MNHQVFEKLATSGALSAEKFVGSNKQVFETSQIFVVRLHGGAVAWASRMCTHVDDPHLPKMLQGLIGSEFVWLWPMNKAFHQSLTRKDRQLRDPAELSAPIDEHEPSISYTPVNPGQMLGPDDVDGCAPVCLSKLTPKQRFFVSSINSQQTLFARRPRESIWTLRMTELIDDQQSKFGNRATAVTLDSPFLPEPVLKKQLSSSVVNSQIWKKRKRAEISESSRQWVNQLVELYDMREQHAIGVLWSGLPDELLSKILMGRMCADIDASAATAAVAITNMRSLSKAWRQTVDEFVVAQLNALHSSVDFSTPTDPGALGRRVRSMGLIPRDVFRMVDWKSYLRLRHLREKSSPSNVNRPRTSPSESFSRIAKRLTFLVDKTHDALLRQSTEEERVALFQLH